MPLLMPLVNRVIVVTVMISEISTRTWVHTDCPTVPGTSTWRVPGTGEGPGVEGSLGSGCDS